MNNNNPFATDLDNTRIFVRGIRKIEVDDLDDLFSTDKDLYLNTGLTPIEALHQLHRCRLINGSMSGLIRMNLCRLKRQWQIVQIYI